MLSQGLDVGARQQLVRYVLTGGLNTVIGFACVLALLAVGVADVAANACGYAVGLLVSFFINRSWTFLQKAPPTAREVVSFIGVFAIAYLANLAVVLVGQSMGYGGNPLLHLVAVVTYSAVGFVLARSIVYGEGLKSKLPNLSGSTITILVCAALACLILPGMPITHDVVWQFWIARQMNHGVELYGQINEVNPPLWFWMAMPIDLLGQRIGVNPITIAQLAMIGLSVVCCFISDRLLPAMSSKHRLIFIANAFALGLVLALGNFAQREQIAMIVALPYMLMIVRRIQGEEVTLSLALGVALIAAPGFALKHYFILVPAALEIWLLFARRWQYRPFRPETLVLLAGAAGYAFAILQFGKPFITEQLPMVVSAYQGYGQPFFSLIDDREQVMWLLCAVALVRFGWLKRESRTPLFSGLLIVMAAFLCSYVLQDKGWVYHSLPVSYFLVLSLIAVGVPAYEKNRDVVHFGLPIAALAAAYIFPIAYGPYDSRYAEDTNRAIAGTPKGSSVYILSSDAQKSWPMIVEQGYIWPSRFMSLWMVPAIAAKMGDKDKLEILSNKIRAMTVEDLRCNPPVTLLVDRAVINRILRPLRFDFLAYFTEDPEAKHLMQNYEMSGKTKKFFVYKLRPDAVISKPLNCRKIY